MNSIQRRVAALEASPGVGVQPMVMIVRRFAGGPLIGYSGDGLSIRRRDGESDEALEDRAVAEATAKGPGPGGYRLLCEVRAST